MPAKDESADNQVGNRIRPVARCWPYDDEGECATNASGKIHAFGYQTTIRFRIDA